NVAAGETGGQLGLSVAGSFVPGGEFTLTAEVRHPVPGQTLTLELPAGFALASGGATEAVPPFPPGAAAQAGAVAVEVRGGRREGSSRGVSQALRVQIRVRGILGS